MTSSTLPQGERDLVGQVCPTDLFTSPLAGEVGIS